MYSKKLQYFFKSKNLLNYQVGDILGFSPAMIGRYLNGTTPPKPEFLTQLIKHFPEIDLQELFKEEHDDNLVSEPQENYPSASEEAMLRIKEIERNLSKVKKFLAQNCHNK